MMKKIFMISIVLMELIAQVNLANAVKLLAKCSFATGD